jgi:hypothetical protein
MTSLLRLITRPPTIADRLRVYSVTWLPAAVGEARLEELKAEAMDAEGTDLLLGMGW